MCNCKKNKYKSKVISEETKKKIADSMSNNINPLPKEIQEGLEDNPTEE